MAALGAGVLTGICRNGETSYGAITVILLVDDGDLVVVLEMVKVSFGYT